MEKTVCVGAMKNGIAPYRRVSHLIESREQAQQTYSQMSLLVMVLNTSPLIYVLKQRTTGSQSPVASRPLGIWVAPQHITCQMEGFRPFTR